MEQAAFFIQPHPVLTMMLAIVILGITAGCFLHRTVDQHRHIGGDEILLDEHEVEIGGGNQ